MKKRPSLPMLTESEPGGLAEELRDRLGGRLVGPGALPAGALVRHRDRVGVVLASQGGTADVLVSRGVVKRLATSHLVAHEGAPPPELDEPREKALVFGSLSEGQPVFVERTGAAPLAGTLREKCRYGALVEVAEGRMLAVGFARLWPREDARGDKPS